MARSSRRSRRSSSPLGFLLIFALFWSAFVIAFDAFLVVSAVRQERAKSYPTTTGVVVSSEVESHRSDDGTTYKPLIVYRYEVDGAEYLNDRYRYGMWSTNDHGRSQRIVDAHPPGREITVYYNPDDPQDALLSVGRSNDEVGLVIFLTPFNLIMLFLWLIVGGMLKRAITNPPAGGVKIQHRGGMTIARLPQYPPVIVGGAVALGISFLGVFVVFFTMGSAPPVKAAAILLGVAFGAGLLVMWWRMWVIGSGTKDLILDPAAATLTLPRSFGRNGDEVRDYDEVESIDVELKIERSSKGDSSTKYFLPTIRWREGTGEDGARAEADHLAKWMESKRAEGFADWLAEQLGASRRESLDSADGETASLPSP